MLSLERAVFVFALLIFSLSCNQLKTSPPPQQKSEEAQKQIPTLFKLKCRAILNPDFNPIAIYAETQIFSVPDFSTNKARISVSVGPFTLISKIIEETREHEFVLPPTFCVDIYNGNFSEPARCEKGYNLSPIFDGLSRLPAGSGTGFIVDFLYQNQKISYLSFDCELIDGETNQFL
jgi:hypothetical protein